MLHRKIIAIALTLTITGNAPRTVVAQTTTMTLEQCLEAALGSSLTVKAANIAVDRAETLKATAFDPDRTAVTFGQETGGGGPDNAITVSQDFEFPTVYVARHKALKAEAELERSNLDVIRAELRRDVTACYFAMLYARKAVELRSAQHTMYQKFMELADRQFNDGQISRLDQINAQRACQLNAIELERAKDEYEAKCLAMAAMLNSERPVHPAESDLRPICTDLLPEAALDFASTPIGRQMQKQVALSERNLTLAKQEFLPGLTVAAVTQLFVKGFNPYHIDRQPFKDGNFLGFEVGVTVPLFFGAQKAKTNAARQEVELSRNMMQQAELTAGNEYRNALNAFATAKKNLDYYRTTAMPQADEIEQLSEKSYRLGEISYPEHVQNMESAMEIRLLHAEAVNEYNQSVIQLDYLRGQH